MSVSSLPAIAQTLYVVPRLRLADDTRPERTDWQLVRGAIEGPLDELVVNIRARRSDIVVRPGAHSAGATRLFVYRTFRRQDRPDADPIVAGVTFLEEEGQLVSRADVCRENSGVVAHDGIERAVAVGEDIEVLAASLGARLARLADTVIDAVDASPDDHGR